MAKDNYEKYCEELRNKKPVTMTYGELGDYRDLILSEAMEEKRPEFMKDSREILKVIRVMSRLIEFQFNFIKGKSDVNGFAMRAIVNRFPLEEREKIAEEIEMMNEEKTKKALKEIERIGGNNESNSKTNSGDN